MNFQDLLKDHNWPVAPEGHHHARTGWIQFDCPFCGRNSRRFHMGYNIQGGYCNCWKCGAHAVLAVLGDITGKYGRTIQGLYEKLDRPTRTEKKIPQGTLRLPKGLVPLLEVHKNYLKKRGLDPEEMQKLWHLEGFGMGVAKYAWRIFIPFYYQGEVVSWTTRSIGETTSVTRFQASERMRQLRYKSAPESHEKISAKDLLFGEDYARHSIIVCEGPFDVFKIGPGAVATCGTSFTQAQLEKISQYPRRTIIFDNEDAAQKRARTICEQLSVFPGKTNLVTLDFKDPGSLSQREAQRLRESFLD